MHRILSFYSKTPLLIKIILAALLGIALGGHLPISVVRIFTTFQVIFSEYLGFAVPLIILGLVISGISALGGNSGKTLILTVCLAYGSTLFAGILSYGASTVFFPGILADAKYVSPPEALESIKVPYFQLEIPPLMDVISALVLAFVLGIGIAVVRSEPLRAMSGDFRKITELMIQKTIVPFLPILIFCLFVKMSADGGVWKILEVFGKVIGIIVLLQILLLTIQYSLAGILTRRNPLKALRVMLPAYFTALGTASSAATLPVTLEQTKKMGVRPEITEFCIPLCATIHLAGCMLNITAFSVAVVLLTGGSLSLQTYIPFIFLLGIAAVAAPGVPGGTIVAASAILESILGFDTTALGLMFTLYIAMDSFGTASNVCGDGAIALTVERFCCKEEDPESDAEIPAALELPNA